MATTDRQRELPPWKAILSSVRAFAHLPDWLVGVIQPERVRRVLIYSIPEFASGTLILQDCRTKHLLLSDDGTGWIGTYHLTVAAPDSGQSYSIQLRGMLIALDQAAPVAATTAAAFGSDEWCQYIPELRVLLQKQPADTQLAMLPQLTDPERARALLERSLQDHALAYRNMRIEFCRPQMLRYHPGLRCTIGYHLAYPSTLATSDNWPTFVVAKTYDGDKGQNAYDCMQALWLSPLGASTAVRIAEPLVYVPELKLLVQRSIPAKETLQALLESTLCADTPEALANLDDSMRKAAVGLATLHSAGVTIGNLHCWEDELTEVRGFVQRLTTVMPELAAAATLLFTSLEALASTCPADAPVPTHGTFRPSQVLLDQGQIGFIDFDSFCQAEPAMDIALFRIATIDMGMSFLHKQAAGSTDLAMQDEAQDRLAQLESIADRFLAHYAALRPVSWQRVAVWEGLNILELVARSWDRVKPKRLTDTAAMLERQLRVLLGEDHTTI